MIVRLLFSFFLLSLPLVTSANVRGLSASDSVITLVLVGFAVLVGVGAVVGASGNFKRQGDGEHSVGQGLGILTIGVILVGWVIYAL